MIAIVNTGGANLRSIENAISRLTDDYLITEDLKQIEKASKIILPGVGNVDRIMTKMNEKGLSDAIRKTKKPVLGICIGMQILFSKSEEGKQPCLGIMKDEVIRLQSKKLSIPHMGWNKVFFDKDNPLSKDLKTGDYFYFVHSFRIKTNKYTVARTHYDENIPAIVNKDNFFGTQFHPEKSSQNGNILLRNFINL